MPWRLVGIDAEDASATRTALTAASTTLAARWLENSSPLTNLAETYRPVTILAKRLADQIMIGKPKTAADRPLALEPSWCTFWDQQLFFVTVVDAESGVLLASQHTAVKTSEWEQMDEGARHQFLSTELPNLADLATQGGLRAREPTNALHVALTLGRNVSRRDEGSSHCLGQLLESELASKFTLVRALGGDHLATVRDLTCPAHGPTRLSRPTRTLVLTWSEPDAESSRQLPAELTLKASVAETVFGKHLPLTHASTWDFKRSGSRIKFALDPGFEKILSGEAETLVLSDWPQVAKVDRAWAYLDRGRAWGLKMNDRVIATVDGQPIKGHVVRFFGPEAKIRSPRGYLIHEGAIIYIRKNQRSVRVGSEFHIDPKTFPAPYPPQSETH